MPRDVIYYSDSVSGIHLATSVFEIGCGVVVYVKVPLPPSHQPHGAARRTFRDVLENKGFGFLV